MGKFPHEVLALDYSDYVALIAYYRVKEKEIKKQNKRSRKHNK